MPKTRPNIDLETIRKSQEPISANSYFMESQRRRAEQEYGWLVASAGMLVGDITFRWDDIFQRDGAVITTDKLRGSANTLNARTLVGYSRLHLPKDISTQGVERFKRMSHETSKVLGRIAINEPGVPIFKPIKTELVAYFDTDQSEEDIATQGIEKYLNDPDSLITGDEATATEEQIALAQKAMKAYYDDALKQMRRLLGLL